jgi:transcriptional regulator with GAF, ATPase, and Fis domain
VQSRIGRIHAAHGGTLFLDEIGDMPLSLQSKILRFLEQGEVQRLGGNDNLKVDVRVVAATNADLKKLVAAASFARTSTTGWRYFPFTCRRCASAWATSKSWHRRLCREVLPRRLAEPRGAADPAQHSWPGNVRELRNAIERATILVGMGRKSSPNTSFCSCLGLPKWARLFQFGTHRAYEIGKCCRVLMLFQ